MGRALKAACASVLLAAALAQMAGPLKQETHPAFKSHFCDDSGCCLDKGMLVIDANWRWSHDASTPESYDNCYEGDWVPEFCPDPATCVQKCAIEGEDEAGYLSQYGVSAEGDSVRLKYVTVHDYGTNVGSRVYMMQGDSYKMFYLKNRELTFTVDTSTLECGVNGALYFVEMPADGDLGKGGNQAGAHYGTGYCDAQCATDAKWIAGSANVPMGSSGYCCSEVDVWEANIHSAAYSMHTCTSAGAETCSGQDCGPGRNGDASRSAGKCDRDGCDYNSYRLGQKTYFGPGEDYTIDSTKPFMVTTQFVTSDGTDDGDLVEIKRIYKQNDVVIENSVASILPPVKRGNRMATATSMTAEFCALEKKMFSDPDDFDDRGGLQKLSEAMSRGMVLVMSIWDDASANMDWLDSTYGGGNQVGDERGDCPGSQGDLEKVRAENADAHVTFSGIRFGAIGTTQGDAAGGDCPGVPKNVYSPERPTFPPTPSPTEPVAEAVPDAIEAGPDAIAAFSDRTGPGTLQPARCSAFLMAVVAASLAAAVLLARRRALSWRVAAGAEGFADEEFLATSTCED